MKHNYNIKRIFTLVITFFVISAFSSSNFNKRADGYTNTEIFKPFLPLAPTPNPITRYYEIELYRVNLAPDGYLKEIFSINGQYPGPAIHANINDTLHITVTNKLGLPTVIHWHGMFQKGTNWYDGVSGQTQCPIPDGVSFVYEFTAAEQYGTYWYHAHTHGQYMEGLRAPLIIHDPNDPYRSGYDYEYVITMSDWYHQRIADLLAKRMAPNYGGLNPIPDSGLISGVGRYNCSAAPPNSNCQPNNPLAVYNVQPGKKYRLRLINTSGLSHFIFSVDGHPLTIIEADGTYSQPEVVNKLPVSIGQRYSVILEANQKVDNYWMRASIDSRCNQPNNLTINADSAINYDVTGILRYEGANSNYPTTNEFDDDVVACLGLEPNQLKMLQPEPVPEPVTNRITLNITIRADDKNVGRAFINNSTYNVDDYHPTLEQFVTNRVQLNQFAQNQNIYAYDQVNGAVEITLLNANGGVHPFHMHGHVFYVLGTGPGLEVDESKLNYDDPFPRDTFSLNSTSWTVVRYKVGNPGVWSIHCHIEWHVEMGMIAQLLELPSELSKYTIPQSVNDLCKYTTNTSQKRSSLPSRFSKRNSKYRVDMKSTKVL